MRHWRKTCSIGWPNPRSIPSDNAASSSASRAPVSDPSPMPTSLRTGEQREDPENEGFAPCPRRSRFVASSQDLNKGAAMAKASSATAGKVADYGVATDRSSQLDGYTVNFVTITKTHDLGPVLASLPGGNCSCPHWGYVLKGRVTVRYADHQETLEAGDAF